jgi:hypothetical protein
MPAGYCGDNKILGYDQWVDGSPPEKEWVRPLANGMAIATSCHEYDCSSYSTGTICPAGYPGSECVDWICRPGPDPVWQQVTLNSSWGSWGSCQSLANRAWLNNGKGNGNTPDDRLKGYECCADRDLVRGTYTGVNILKDVPICKSGPGEAGYGYFEYSFIDGETNPNV